MPATVVQGAIDMQRGHKTMQQPSLELPARFDPSGIPCVDSGHGHSRAHATHRRHARPLPGLAPKSLMATVEVVAERGQANWLVWGTDGERPVLFAVAAAAAAEMVDSMAAGERPTAIVEPWQVMLERLD